MRRVAFVSAGAEGEAAFDWLTGLAGVTAARHGSATDVDLPETDLLWIHAVSGEAPTGLTDWLQRGGRLLLTLDAVTLAHRVGLEPTAPDETRAAAWHHADDEFWLDEYRSFLAFPHLRGFAAFGPHPLFHDLDQGTYTWAPSEGESYRWVAYRRERPSAGSGIAVERSFIHLNAERLIAWEYSVGAGGVLCIGAFVHLAAKDALLAPQLQAMLANAVSGDAVPHVTRAAPISQWPADGRFDGSPVGSLPVEPPSEVWNEWPPSASPILLQGPVRGDEPWTLAGRRVLVAGGESSGIREVWAHPWRVVKDVRLLVAGREPTVLSVRVAPDEFVRTLRAGEVMLTERITTALEHGVVAWSLEADPATPVELSWTTDFRRMWPYPARQRIRFLLGTASAGSMTAHRIGPVDETPRLEVQCHAGTIASPAGADGRWVAQGHGAVRLLLVAGCDDADLDRALGATRRRTLRGLRQERILHARRLDQRLAALETPEPDIDLGLAWAKVRLDSFLAETPGLGRSLMAGYGASRPGWADGRPGYAWYFGRDACWTAFATLAMGDHGIARDVIRFLARNQDVTGKVLHEYTTSGLVHFDAADSTPLFLLLAGRYAAWTADLSFLERQWPALEAAYRFCLTTDQDGDGLIENHRVGHGWIEHGPLGGLHVTLYLSACWVAALESLAPVARALGRHAFATELAERAGTAREAMARRFLTDRGWALGLETDGSPRVHATAMLSVPLLLGAVHPDGVAEWFDAVASERFSTPWGVRMIADDDPLFDPAGYHQGAVWPLYTGWVSQAEWIGGRWESGLAHLRATAGLVDERARGAFDEVLHGTDRKAAGICPDQAWSAAMVVSPAVEGLWGVAPDALRQRVAISPWLPEGWNEMALRRLRVGGTTLDLRLRRKAGRQVLQLSRLQGRPIRLTASLRSRMAISAVLLNDEPLGGGRAVFDTGEQDEVQFMLG